MIRYGRRIFQNVSKQKGLPKTSLEKEPITSPGQGQLNQSYTAMDQ